MRYIELRGKSDLRLIALGLAHGMQMTKKCAIATEDVAFVRLGTQVKDRVYLCDQVYVVVIPELFAVQTEEQLTSLLDVAANMVTEETGESVEDVILSWTGRIKTSFDIKAEVELYKTGMKNVAANEYSWSVEGAAVSDSDTLHYMVFYDKNAHKKASYEGVDKVLVSDGEMISIRQMEQTGKFRMISGGFFGIANDIAIKKCGVFEGALRELVKK